MAKKPTEVRLTPDLLREISKANEIDLPMAEMASRRLLRDQVEEVLHTLNPKERRVLQLRFGLEDGRSKTYAETAAELSTTPEDVKNTEKRALRKLRFPKKPHQLKDYLE